jgi:two-component system nitrate/nitrite response regulator NarL
VLLLLVEGRLGQALSEALVRAANGERYRIPSDMRVRLTPAQRLTLRYVAAGQTDKQIAQQLGLAPGTVRNRVSEIIAELRLDNRSQLILYYWSIDPYGESIDALS